MKHIVFIVLFILMSSSLFGEVIELSPTKTMVDVFHFDEQNVLLHISLDKFERSVQQNNDVTFDDLVKKKKSGFTTKYQFS